MTKQLYLFSKIQRANITGLDSLSFGGGLRKGKRKIARPFSEKKSTHLVLKALDARGPRSMLARSNREEVKKYVYEFAARNAVRIEGYSNVGNHLHLIIRAKKRAEFKRFLRTVAGLIARHILKAKKTEAKGKFWAELAFTRVIQWGRDLLNLKHYITKNEFEGSGIPIQTPQGIKLFRIRDGTLRCTPRNVCLT